VAAFHAAHAATEQPVEACKFVMASSSLIQFRLPAMRRYISISSMLLLGLLVHLDWHLGRSHDHRFSGEWSYHWITGFFGCLLIVFLVTRKSPRWLTPAVALNVALGLVLGQFLEPRGEALVSHLPVAQIVTAERSQVFRDFMMAGIAGLVAGILLFGKQKSENILSGMNSGPGHRPLP
jgi:hypothetical protein